MTRKKVRLAYIANDSARKATFKKRKKGFMKKVRELSTLCGIEACAILYSPYDSMPEVWPDQAGVQHVLTRFRGMSEMDQSKKMVNQESFLRQRIIKASEQLKKQRRDNREKEVIQVMFHSLVGNYNGLQGLTVMDLNDLGWIIAQNIKEIDRRLAETETTGAGSGSNVVVERASCEVSENNALETMQRQQWFMDLMNPQDHVGFGGVVGGDDVTFPCAADDNNPLWPNFIP